MGSLQALKSGSIKLIFSVCQELMESGWGWLRTNWCNLSHFTMPDMGHCGCLNNADHQRNKHFLNMSTGWRFFYESTSTMLICFYKLLLNLKDFRGNNWWVFSHSLLSGWSDSLWQFGVGCPCPIGLLLADASTDRGLQFGHKEPHSHTC